MLQKKQTQEMFEIFIPYCRRIMEQNSENVASKDQCESAVCLCLDSQASDEEETLKTFVSERLRHLATASAAELCA